MPSHEEWTVSAHHVFHVIVYRRPISNVNTQHTAYATGGEMALERCDFPYLSKLNSATARFDRRAHHTLSIRTIEKLNCRGFGYKTRLSAENGLANFSSRLLRIFEGKMNGVHFVHLSGQFHFVFLFFGAALITLSKCCGLRCWDICDFFFPDAWAAASADIVAVHVQNVVIMRRVKAALFLWRKKKMPAFDCVPERFNGNRVGTTW